MVPSGSSQDVVSLAMYILLSVLVGLLELDAYIGLFFLCVTQKKNFLGDVLEV